MKNVLIIDTRSRYECNAVSYDNEKKNSVFLHILSDVSLNPKLEIEGETVQINDVYFVYEISTNLYLGSGVLKFRITDDQQVGEYVSISKIEGREGQLVLTKNSSFSYALGFDMIPLSQISKDVFRNGGSHYKLQSNQYFTGGNYGINLGNSDLVGGNSIWMNDTANTEAEGLMFLKNGGVLSNGIENYTYNADDWMCLRAYNEELLFMNYPVWHKGMTFKKLWSGTWGSGSITVPGFTDYQSFMVQLETTTSGGIGTMVLAFKHPEWEMLRGHGGYRSAAGNFMVYSFAATTSGNTLTFVNAGEIYINKNTTITDCRVIGLYGIM